MALYDNKYWLLSHIRNSFISSDDTGMCELIMVGEEKAMRENFFSKEPFGEANVSDEEDDDDRGSYEFQIEGNFGMAERSMADVRLDKLENQTRKYSKVKHIKWETKMDTKQEDTKPSESLFVLKKFDASSNAEPKKSALTALIQQSANIPVNPYMEYAQFDGTNQVSVPTRKYRIFLTMLPKDEQRYPLGICCIATAKIQELIGLTLFKFSTNNSGNYPLKSVSKYRLHITEEDGEVDSDFPCFDNKECVAKFDFSCLGLVELKESLREASLEATEQTPASPESLAAKKRTISSSKAEETKKKNDMMLLDDHNKAMEAPLYKSYRVYIVNKLWWWNIEVLLGISSEKIEIDPITQKNSKLQLVKQVPVCHSMESIAWCEKTESRNVKTNFRVVYSNGFEYGNSDRSQLYPHSAFSLSSTLQSSPSFKHYDFEADRDVAEEIVSKINLILSLRCSQSRRDYLAAKDRKHLSKRKSFKYLRP